jgi:hypothetical protein
MLSEPAAIPYEPVPTPVIAVTLSSSGSIRDTVPDGDDE